jgi:hypothetical protein
MNEHDWLTAPDFAGHARFADQFVSPRRLRLLACGFCRAAGNRLPPELTAALDVAERFADGRASGAEADRARRACRELAQKAYEGYASQIDWGQGSGDPLSELVRCELAWAVANAASTPLSAEAIGGRVLAISAQADLGLLHMLPAPSPELSAALLAWRLALRAVAWEVVGNPFRPLRFDPAWRTSTAAAIAEGMWDAGEFSAAPILADALQDAGCDNDDLLAHLRAEGVPHLRGCWAIDLVLQRQQEH